MSCKQQIIKLKKQLSAQVIGQESLIERLLIALLANGHLLAEGAPGLAKTRSIKALATSIEADFHRVQFTPDLLPSDVTGTEIYRPEKGQFEFVQGPIFHNLILADEINRAPAKVQAALLEAMAEKQVSVGQKSFSLPELFLVMATQNPIEQEGTYPLPEAQLDRFMLQVTLDYPDAEAEHAILQLTRNEEKDGAPPPPFQISQHTIFQARKEILALHMDPVVEAYIVQLIMATRRPERYDAKLAEFIDYGASPRATIALDKSARAKAWLQGREYVSPEDVQELFFDVLRHRVLLSYEAQAQNVTADDVLVGLLDKVAVG